MAHISRDAGLLKAFEAGEDIHRATAAEIFMQGYYKRKRPARFRVLGVEPSRKKHAMEEDSSI